MVTEEKVEHLLERITALEDRVAELEQKNEELEQENQRLRAKVRWYEGPHTPPSKVLAR